MFFIFDYNDSLGDPRGTAIINIEKISSIDIDTINRLYFVTIHLVGGKNYGKAFKSIAERSKYFDSLIKELHVFKLEERSC